MSRKEASRSNQQSPRRFVDFEIERKFFDDLRGGEIILVESFSVGPILHERTIKAGEFEPPIPSAPKSNFSLRNKTKST